MIKDGFGLGRDLTNQCRRRALHTRGYPSVVLPFPERINVKFLEIDWTFMDISTKLLEMFGKLSKSRTLIESRQYDTSAEERLSLTAEDDFAFSARF